MAFPFRIDTGLTRRIAVSGTIDLDSIQSRGIVKILGVGPSMAGGFRFEVGNNYPGPNGAYIVAGIGNQTWGQTFLGISDRAIAATFSGYIDVRLYLDIVLGFQSGDDFDIGIYDGSSEYGLPILGCIGVEAKDPTGSYYASIDGDSLGVFTVSGANSGLTLGEFSSYCYPSRNFRSDYFVLAQMFARGSGSALHSVDIGCILDSVIMSDYVYSETQTNVDSTINLDTSTGNVFHMDATSTRTGGWSASAQVTRRYNTQYDLGSFIYNIGKNLYPTALEMLTVDSKAYPTGSQTAAGSYSITPSYGEHVLIQGGMTYNLGGTSLTFTGVTLYEGGGLLCGINPSSLALSDEMKDSRTFIRLPHITKVGTLMPQESIRIEEFDTVGGSTEIGKWRYATLSGGFVHVDSSSVIKTEKVYNTDTTALENFRYMKIRVRSVGAATQTVTMKRVPFSAGNPWDLEREYTFQTGADGTWVDVVIDLLAPINPKDEFGAAVYYSTQDSRYPVVGGRLHNNGPAKMEPGWGLNYLYMLRFEFTASTGNYEFDYIDVFRTNEPTLSAVNSTITQQAAFGDLSKSFSLGVICDTEGRRSLELPINGYPGTFPDWKDGLIDRMVQNQPGWMFTYYATGIADPYYNLSYWGYFGNGVILNVTTLTTTFYIDEPVPTAGLDVPYQLMVDYIYLPPGSGNMYKGGAAATTSELKSIKILRGKFTGVDITRDGTILSGVTITATEQWTGNDAGSDITDAAGRYTTDYPFAKGTPTISPRSHLVGVPTELLPVSVGNRHVKRVCFSKGTADATNPFSWWDLMGRYYRTDVIGGLIRIQRSQWSLPPFETYSNPSTSSDNLNPRAFADPTTQTLYVVFQHMVAVDNSTTLYVESNDDGQTWDSEVAAFTGIAIHGTGNASIEGVIVLTALKPDVGSSGPGVVYGRVKGPGDAAFGSEFVYLNNLGANLRFEDDSFHIFPILDGGTGWILTGILEGDTAPSEWYSADETATWTKVL